ncbi:hypothetical protein TELCIR_10135 [Teladorsagia circumcincta]|uniref:DNA2/NAM7 helicase-like C-terminal domain-containing protein n=1 Tax=Teladorsagia circumcincta TaxID=45464 RepID=A0A2G9UED1_TELCI|nr:hypothetical protein TELCIR_10135 [Teladorsagia circumcincta]
MISDAETIEEAITSNEKYPELCDMFDKMNASTDQGARGKMKTEANKLKWKIIKESYKRRLAIFCTLTSSAIQRLAQVNWHPDVIIIDEAAQASEPVAWAAVVQAKRCILAGEAALVIRYVDVLKSIGLPGKEIAVISPYYAQVAAIRDTINALDVSVNTVDSFQGQEREVVVFSMVRHNPEQVIGFLQNERRLNVAITRAKRQFVLIGSARMMKKNRHLRSLLSTIQSCGKIYGPGMMHTFEKEVSALPTIADKKTIVVQP